MTMKIDEWWDEGHILKDKYRLIDKKRQFIL